MNNVLRTDLCMGNFRILYLKDKYIIIENTITNILKIKETEERIQQQQ